MLAYHSFMGRWRQITTGAGEWAGSKLGAVVRRVALQGLTIHASLLLGFGLIFGLWLFSGYSLLRRMGDVESRASVMNARFTRSEELLFTVRTQVLLSAIYRRDALLDTDPGDVEYYTGQLRATRDTIERALSEYQPVVNSPAERENWNTLRRQIADYWQTLQPDRIWDPSRTPIEARSFLRRHVIPKREIIIHISERIQALNREAFSEQQAELGLIHREMRRRFLWITALALLIAAAVAMVVLRYAGQLEARIRQQHLEDRANKLNLQRLSAQLVRAQEEERRNISRELHDEIGQALTAIKMDLSQAERSLDSPAKARQPLEEARFIADRVLQEVRDLSQLLHPSMLDDLGLPDTLKWYLRGFSKRTGIRAEFVPQGMSARLPIEIELCAYRVVQEALTNIARHAGATACRVEMCLANNALSIVVEDDGKGFEPQEHPRTGLGLVGIQERISGLRGQFDLESRKGKGTRLRIELPATTIPAETEPLEGEGSEVAPAANPSLTPSAEPQATRLAD